MICYDEKKGGFRYLRHYKWRGCYFSLPEDRQERPPSWSELLWPWAKAFIGVLATLLALTILLQD